MSGTLALPTYRLPRSVGHATLVAETTGWVIARPNERTNTRDAQKDLRLFYAALCPLDEYLRLIPETEWESRFMDD